MRGLGVFVYAVLLSNQINLNYTDLDKKSFKAVHMRNVFVATQQLFIYYVQTRIPLSIVSLLNTLTPLTLAIWDNLLSGVVLTRKTIFWMIVCFFGALITSSSEYLDVFFGFRSEKSVYLENEAQGFEKFVLCVLTLVSVFLWSYGVIIGKQANKHPFILQMSFGILQIMTGGVVVIIREVQFQILDAVIAIFVIGFIYAFQQSCYMQGIQMASSSGKFQIVTYWNVILAFLYQIVILGVLPSCFVFIGAFLIIFGGFHVIK